MHISMCGYVTIKETYHEHVNMERVIIISFVEELISNNN